MDKILDVIEKRCSIRKYKNQEVKKEDILTILEAARLSASGNNLQPWKFIVITDQEKRREIVHADGKQEWMMSAPVFIACLADPSQRMESLAKSSFDENSSSYELKRSIRDTSIAITSMMYQATALGLATCWTGNYNQKDMREALDIPDNYWVSAILTLGYPLEEGRKKNRRDLNDIVEFE